MMRKIILKLLAVTVAVLAGAAHGDIDDSYSSSAYPTVKFSYDTQAGANRITCNGVERPNTVMPTPCDFDDQGKLTITLTSWKGETALLTSTDTGIITITGSCRQSLIKGGENAYNLNSDCVPNDGGEGETVIFEFNPEGGSNKIKCNSSDPIAASPTKCRFGPKGNLTVQLTSWSGRTAILKKTSVIGKTTLSGVCRKSAVLKSELNYNLTLNCIPTATGEQLVDEWLTDLPWHQKLSTKDSNLIDVPFVLPGGAISTTFCPESLDAKEKARCMLRYGIVNVMSMHRTDTLYLPAQSPKNQDCGIGKGDCVEMEFDFRRLHTQTKDPLGYEAESAKNNSYKIGAVTVPSLGFALTEATIFVPWRFWYMGHYCAVFADEISDSVCYEDYFTTQLQAWTHLGGNQVWLRDRPALFYPQSDDQFGKLCAKGSEVCPMFLGKVGFQPDLSQPKVVACTKNNFCCKNANECEQQRQEVITKTGNLDTQYKFSLSKFADIGRYPWNEATNDEILKLNDAFKTNPFTGYYELIKTGVHGESGSSLFEAQRYFLPKKCSMQDFTDARLKGDAAAIQRLKACSADFEVHPNGFYDNWNVLYGGIINSDKPADADKRDAAVKEIRKVFHNLGDNQYGRTMFMYAGLPEQKIPLSFVADKLDGGNKGVIQVHDKIYGSSLYTQYLPLINADDLTLKSKYYTDDFWHAIFMSNHMNQTPDHFIRGIRGRTLWHNEYRSNLMYKAYLDKTEAGTTFEGLLDPVNFPAGFQRKDYTSPFHGNTCDSCHIRNGGGVPLMPNGKLPQIHVAEGHDMKDDYRLYPVSLDYTYTNKDLEFLTDRKQPKTVIPSMKLVFFDLKEEAGPLEECDANDHATPKAFLEPKGPFYNNKIMNFYGNSFHVNLEDGLPTYTMQHVAIGPNSGFVLVDNHKRRPYIVNKVEKQKYVPKRVNITNIDAGTQRCTKVKTEIPPGVDPNNWPKTCKEVNGAAILQAINNDRIGFIQLLGKRLGNTPLIEMIPSARIKVFKNRQMGTDPIKGGITHAGCYGLAPGTRAGEGGATNYRSCKNQRLGNTANDCYISRWGWIGDRVSLEDQIANAAHVEMNLSSKESYRLIHPGETNPKQLVRYDHTLCGPADAGCQANSPNSDITEEEIRNMATYQRWIGIPERAEYQVSSEKVQRGEVLFKQLGCAGCHVIEKIKFIATDNILPDEERAALKKLQSSADPNYPFVSYLGTDLLLHDMGYLSQVAKAPADAVQFRNDDGTINPIYRSYFQLIRTPPLKGLRFNRFVTDSNHNSTVPINKETADKDPKSIKPGCDFLLHDGRACDAIEAAYLHDGPAVKALGMIERLNGLSDEKLDQMRAFLYSL